MEENKKLQFLMDYQSMKSIRSNDIIDRFMINDSRFVYPSDNYFYRSNNLSGDYSYDMNGVIVHNDDSLFMFNYKGLDKFVFNKDGSYVEFVYNVNKNNKTIHFEYRDVVFDLDMMRINIVINGKVIYDGDVNDMYCFHSKHTIFNMFHSSDVIVSFNKDTIILAHESFMLHVVVDEW